MKWRRRQKWPFLELSCANSRAVSKDLCPIDEDRKAVFMVVMGPVGVGGRVGDEVRSLS